MAFNTEDITFSHISINEGLSQSTVFSITQDKADNMWFATYDGVNRYDGYEFTIYRHSDKDSTSIAGDIARCVMTDSKGRVFVGTDKGVSYYDRATDSFVNFLIKDRKNVLVTDIVELSDGKYMVNSGNKLLVLDVPSSTYSDSMLPAGLDVNSPAADDVLLPAASAGSFVGPVIGSVSVRVASSGGDCGIPEESVIGSECPAINPVYLSMACLIPVISVSSPCISPVRRILSSSFFVRSA